MDSKMRNLSLVKGVKRVLGCHASVDRAKRGDVIGTLLVAFGMVFAGIVGVGVAVVIQSLIYAAVTHSASSETISIMVGLVSGFGVFVFLGAAILVWAIVFRKVKMAHAREKLGNRIKELVGDFPQEIQSWGGPVSLRDQDLVRQLVLQLDASEASIAG